jgi:hypothetical protein
MVHQELLAGKRMHSVTIPQRWLAKRKILKNITDPVKRIFSSLPSHDNGQLSRMDYQPLRTRWHKAKEQTSRIKSKHNIYLIAGRKRRQIIWKTNPSEACSLYHSQEKIYWRYVIRIPRNRATIFLYYCWEYPGTYQMGLLAIIDNTQEHIDWGYYLSQKKSHIDCMERNK